MTELRAALTALPKVELHCHVEGTMRPATVMELAAANGIHLPTAEVTELYDYRSLDEFLAVFWLVQSVLGRREDWARLGYESVLDGAAAGRVYAETFVSPTRLVLAGQTLGSILAGLAEGLAAGDAETGATTMVIVDMDRAFGAGAGLQLVTDLVELRRTGAPGTERVLGVGMDSTEIGVDPLSFGPAYAAAAAAGLRLTGHQGEDTPAGTVASLVTELGCERVDHGLSLAESPSHMALFADRRVPLTVCPTSNIVIANRYASLAEHPFPRLRDAGVLVTLNTDDPALTNLDLATEYDACAAAWGFDFATMVDVALAGVEASWLDDADKRALAERVRSEGARLSPGPGTSRTSRPA